MIRVYRVEHLDVLFNSDSGVGVGPYVCWGSSSDWYGRMINHHADSINFPPICVDGLYGKDTPDHVCCFTSIEKMLSWFDGYLPYLLEEGFGCVEYVISSEPIIGTSEKQALFDIGTILSREVLDAEFEVGVIDEMKKII